MTDTLYVTTVDGIGHPLSGSWFLEHARSYAQRLRADGWPNVVVWSSHDYTVTNGRLERWTPAKVVDCDA